VKLCKKLKKKCSLVQDKIIIEGKSYSVNNLDDLPFDISGIGTKLTERYVLFCGRLSPYSNFFTKPNLFTVEGIEYCSAEQYFQYHNALSGKDYKAAAEILDTCDPLIIKHAGNKVTPCDDWIDKAPVIMEVGVTAKFAQNTTLLTDLSNTTPRKFQECNQFDSYWGIGLSLSEAIARDDYEKVSGKNVMGSILENVRNHLVKM